MIVGNLDNRMDDGRLSDILYSEAKWRVNEGKLENWPILNVYLSNSHRDGSMRTTPSMILEEPVISIMLLEGLEIDGQDA